MKTRFKIRLIFRGVSIFAVVVSFLILLSDLYSDEAIIYDILYFLIFGYLATDLNRTEYILTDGSLIIKRLFLKDEIFLFDDITRIEETSYLIAYIRIFLNSRKKPLLLMNDHIEEFVTIILKAIDGKRNISFDQNGKGITLSNI